MGPTLGYHYKSRDFELLYNVRMTCFSGARTPSPVAMTCRSPPRRRRRAGDHRRAGLPLTFDGGAPSCTG
ncbi:MAG: hypothetical protein IPK85_15225 [Gemmatimonadetes bacterium]|nr:hypothetical protein [Gemmatimonadota bacterium]